MVIFIVALFGSNSCVVALHRVATTLSYDLAKAEPFSIAVANDNELVCDLHRPNLRHERLRIDQEKSFVRNQNGVQIPVRFTSPNYSLTPLEERSYFFRVFVTGIRASLTVGRFHAAFPDGVYHIKIVLRDHGDVENYEVITEIKTVLGTPL